MTEVRVLIIDDRVESRQTLCRYLHDIPEHEFDCCESELAQDGYEHSKPSHFDLALLD